MSFYIPEKLLYNAWGTCAILLFSEEDDKNQRGKIEFINTSNEFEKQNEVRKLNQPYFGNIERIAKTFETH